MARKRSKDKESDDEIEDDELYGDGDEEKEERTTKARTRDVEEDDEEDEDDDDDEDDEDDDEDESSGRAGHRKRKKRKTGMSIFIDEEAEEDDEADEEEDDDDIAADNGIIDDVSDGEGGKRRSSGREALRAQRLRQEHARMDENRENILTRIEQRYANEEADADDAADEDDVESGMPLDASGVDQQSLQPTIRDPRLFVLRCRKPGYERRAILTLLQKMFDLRERNVDIGIMSAIAPDHLRGFIYVEAYSASQVEHAIKGLDLIVGYNGIKPVPLEEMTDVLQVGRKLDKQKKGNWVRLTRGIYKGDLAQVYSEPDGPSDQIMVRLIPRLKLRREGAEHSDPEDEGDEDAEYDDDPKAALGHSSGKLRKRPPQKLFDPRHVARLEGGLDEAVLPQRDRLTGEVFDAWNGELFRHGLCYRRVALRTLVINDAVQPTPEEVERWIAAEARIRVLAKDKSNDIDPRLAAEGLGLDVSGAVSSKVQIFRGDNVKVIRGEQKGLVGNAVGFDGDIVLIQNSEWGDIPLRAARADVVKNFRLGDHVKISSGRGSGHSGVIVAIAGDSLTVFTDSTREEIRVLSSNVTDSSDIGTDQNTFAMAHGKQIKLFDLVYPRQDRDAKGVVIGVKGDTLSILDGANMVHEYPGNSLILVPHDMYSHALDGRGNKLSRNIALNVISGPMKDRSGVIVEVSGNTVFFRGNDEVRNCGILAVAARDCEAQAAAARSVSGTATGKVDSSGQFKVPNPVPKGAISSLGGGRNGRGVTGAGIAFKSRDSMVGADVKVTKGPYKGHLGKVVDVSETTVRVELQSRMKVVTLTRDKVKSLNGKDENVPGTGSGLGTGRSSAGTGFTSFGSTAPGSRTPNPYGNMGARTPYGGRTPSHAGARTPAHAGALGLGNRTPAHYGAFSGLGSRTPAHSALGSSTPRMGSVLGSGIPTTPSIDAFRPATPRADDYGSLGSFGGGPNRGYGSSYGATIPTTPGTPAMIPVTPAGGGLGVPPPDAMTPADPSYIPQTPIGYLPQTPQIGQYEPQTPYVDVNTPGPMIPQTPRTPDPSTPLPQTPAPMDDGSGNAQGFDEDSYRAEGVEQVSYKVLIDVVVSLPDMGGRSAVVLDAAEDGHFVTVRMSDDNVVHELNGTQFTPVQPRVGVDSLVKVLDGPFGGRVGRLLDIDTSAGDGVSSHGRVEFGRGEIQAIELVLMAKYQRASKS